MTLIKELQIESVMYRKIDSIPASFAVQKGNQGTALKHTLDEIMSTLDYQETFREHAQYLQLPERGIVQIGATARVKEYVKQGNEHVVNNQPAHHFLYKR